MDSGDAAIREFAMSAGPEWDLFDLRAGKAGTGFPWGRYGDPDESVKKHPQHRLFRASAHLRAFPSGRGYSADRGRR